MRLICIWLQIRERHATDKATEQGEGTSLTLEGLVTALLLFLGWFGRGMTVDGTVYLQSKSGFFSSSPSFPFFPPVSFFPFFALVVTEITVS